MRLKVGLIVFCTIVFASCSTRIDHAIQSGESSPQALNINIATVSELEQLPAIGRATAEAIVSYRNENGRFRRVEHVMLIRGVSEKRFAEIRPLIKID